MSYDIPTFKKYWWDPDPPLIVRDLSELSPREIEDIDEARKIVVNLTVLGLWHKEHNNELIKRLIRASPYQAPTEILKAYLAEINLNTSSMPPSICLTDYIE